MNPTQIMPRQDTQYLDAHQDPWHYGALDHEIGGGLGQLVEFTDNNGVRRKAQIRPGNGNDRILVKDPRKTKEDNKKHTGYVRIADILYKVSGDKKDTLERINDPDQFMIRTGNRSIKDFPTVGEYAAYLEQKTTNTPAGKSKLSPTIKQMWTLNEGGSTGLSVSSDNDVLKWLWGLSKITTNTPSQIIRLAAFVHKHSPSTMLSSFKSKIQYFPKTKKSGTPHPELSKLNWEEIWEKAEKPRPIPTKKPPTRGKSADARSNAEESVKSGASARSTRSKTGKKAQNVALIPDERVEQWIKTGLSKLKKTSNIEALTKKLQELLRRAKSKSKPKPLKGPSPAHSVPGGGAPAGAGTKRGRKKLVDTKNNYNPGEIPLLSMRYPGEGMRL